MSLLQQIQNDAVGSDVSLAVILRKCQVLAARLDHEPLRDWARSEVEGYAGVADLPDYRKTGPLEAYGSFMRAGIQSFPKLPIPRAAIPQDRRERLFAHQFLQGVAQLEPLAASDPRTTFSIAWPNDAIAQFGHRIYQDMVCLEAHVPITPHMIVGVLDTIRNRVLAFALDLEGRPRRRRGSDRRPGGRCARARRPDLQHLRARANGRRQRRRRPDQPGNRSHGHAGRRREPARGAQTARDPAR